MTDLIERLKAAGATSCLDRTSPFTTTQTATLHCEAAAEIERLRKTIVGLRAQTTRLMATCDALQEDKTDG